MTKVKSPTQTNPTFLIPVNPAIEKYMLSLSGSSDHPVLDQMEQLAREQKFPNRWQAGWHVSGNDGKVDQCTSYF